MNDKECNVYFKIGISVPN